MQKFWCMVGLAVGLAVCPLWAKDSLRLSPIGSYTTGRIGEGVAEIIAYHPPQKRLFSINTADRCVDIFDLASPSSPRPIGKVEMAEFGSVPTSVSMRSDVLAASIVGKTPNDRGTVVFFTPDGVRLASVPVGYHPDMVMFSPDGKWLIVANEGEPSADGLVDHDGSVSVIEVSTDLESFAAKLQVREADFNAWNNQPLPAGVRLAQPGNRPSTDFEPEGIAISGDSQTAYISLQENNAIAVVDLAEAKVKRIFGLGYKDHRLAENEVDVFGLGHEKEITCCPAKGMYQPDNVGWFTSAGKEYLILANEGDARDNLQYHEESQLKDWKLDPQKFPNAEAILAKYGSLFVSRTGDIDQDQDLDEILTFGGRSISIFDAQGTFVFDSGSQIEHHVCRRLDSHQHDPEDAKPKYSTKKGPEPEGLCLATLHGKTYVFVGLERDNGIVAWDVTSPHQPELVAYVNPFECKNDKVDPTSDMGPEGLVFVPAQDSPNGMPLLIVANEYSGSITVYQVDVVSGLTAAVKR